MLLVTIEKFGTNPMLVKVNRVKPYKHMEFEVQKQEKYVPVYWKQNTCGL
jgi:hypothetical protein